jgi:SNF2 family DNA or RNA helicase
MVEYQWPEININDVYVELDIVQQNIYDAEKMLHHNNDKLRRLVCEINLMFSDGEFNTPNELKQYGIKHYQKLYEIEQSKLDELNSQLENIKANVDKFEKDEYERRVKHFKDLIQNQTEKTTKYKTVSEFFMAAIENINKVISNTESNKMEIDNTEEDEDIKCPICWDIYSPPISYIKSCGHYFCKSCLDNTIKFSHNKSCPKCRNNFSKSDIINVQQMSDINNSSKIHELLSIINHSSDGNKYIIFTQFDKVIDKIKLYLTRNNITSETYNNYNGEHILLLSSQQNAEGIDLSMFDKMIIFEPFEDNVYCNQVEKQLIARIHRIGRYKPVDVYRFITKGTIEEDIYKLTSN